MQLIALTQSIEESIRSIWSDSGSVGTTSSSSIATTSIQYIADRIGYRRPWDASLRERFLLLVTVSIKAQYWGRVIRQLFHQRLCEECSNIAFFYSDDDNTCHSRHSSGDLLGSLSQDSRPVAVPSSAILSLYKRIQMKCRYLSQLDANRIRVIYRMIDELSHLDEGLLDCKHLSSLLFAAKVLHAGDGIDNLIATEFSNFKRLVKHHRGLLDHEALFLDWVMSAAIDNESIHKSCSESASSVAMLNLEKSINALIQSGMLPQLERRVSSYMYSNDPAKEALVTATRSASDTLIAPIELKLALQYNGGSNAGTSISTVYDKYLDQRDELMRNMMDNEHRQLQSRLVNVRFPTTLSAEAELRSKNAMLLKRMQEIVAKESPFEIRSIQGASRAYKSNNISSDIVT